MKSSRRMIDLDKLNEAINIIKNVCSTYSNCVDCPMNPNCNESPTQWNEVKKNEDIK